MNSGLIIINGYFCNEAVKNQIESLEKEFSKLNIEIDVFKSNAVLAYISQDNIVCKLEKYRFIIFLDKDYILAKMLEKCGYKLFNSAEAIRLCDDKMLTYVSLADKGIDMPKTIPSPLQYSSFYDKEFIEEVENKIPYPIIIKKVYGSMGKNVFMAKNHSELTDYYEKLKSYPHLYQQKVGKEGEDIRAIVIGNQIVASMKRINENDFRSNIELGGRGENIVLTENQKKICLDAVKILGLDYAGIDILSGDKDYICEVNSNAFFKGITSVTKVNVAEKYATYILKNS